MNKKTVKIKLIPEIPTLYFSNENGTVGYLKCSSGKLEFKGNMTESAKKFFEMLKGYVDNYIEESITKLPDEPIIITFPNATEEEMFNFKKKLDKLERKYPLFLYNKKVDVDTDFINKQKVKEAINKLKEKLLNRMCSPISNPDDILDIVKEIEEELEI